MNTIIILDSFIRNKSEEDILINFLDKISLLDKDIFLISNTIIEKKILDKVNYFFYDKKNRLFEGEYTNTNKIYYWTDCGEFIVYDTVDNVQKHGLSVLINLFNSLKILKEFGYTHFIKMEYDAYLGLETVEKVKQLINNQKKGIFFEEFSENKMNMNVHFFYSEINFFLENFWNIDSEESYKNHLLRFQNNLDFLTMERFLWENLNILNKNDIEIRGDFHSLFSDTIWNLKQTLISHDSKYDNCLTKLYLGKKIQEDKILDLDEMVILTRNLKEKNEFRRVVVLTDDGNTFEFFHEVSGIGSWTYNFVPKKAKKIMVYNNDNLLYEDFLSDENTKIEFK